MQNIIEIQLWQFGLIYLLLLVVLFIMKKGRIDNGKLLVVASIRMTVQLILAGLILTYIIEHPHPLFTILYFLLMTTFAILRVLRQNPGLNRGFRLAVALSLFFSGM